MDISIAQLSQRGGRSNNEDRSGYAKTEKAALLVLADGMGGHPDGEVAAEIAVKTCVDLFQQLAMPTIPDPAEFLVMALRAAHYKIIRHGVRSNRQMELNIPRTTAVICLLQQDKIWWAHCGDSRFYLVRDGKIEICTVDHSYAKSRHSFMMIPDLENISRSTLYTCLGSDTLPMIQGEGPIAVIPGDRVILCSDGLWSAVSDNEITKILAAVTTLSTAVAMMVDKALKTAGKNSDNVTVIALEWASELYKELMAEKDLESLGPANEKRFPLSKTEKFDNQIDQSISEINELLKRLSNHEGSNT